MQKLFLYLFLVLTAYPTAARKWDFFEFSLESYPLLLVDLNSDSDFVLTAFHCISGQELTLPEFRRLLKDQLSIDDIPYRYTQWLVARFPDMNSEANFIKCSQ